ncbi:MAG: type II secretion system F family protein [Gordonia sp. (in: high G+C Gram-positive bacteria)]|uniref:type II secretion system F family protein n=1 Tax=Gordonia sp. (in: high G+C Gram-positive bacteria) TaxID=84139 RepID=UPI0039E36EC9
MTAVVLLLAALAVVVWPTDTAGARLDRITGAVRTPRHAPGLLLAVAAVPVVGILAGSGAMIAAVIAGGVIGLRRRRRSAATARRRHDEALRRALTVMAAELSVGAPMVGACRSAAAETSPSDPVDRRLAAELDRIAARVELGGVPDADSDPPEVEPPSGDAGVRRVAESWAVSARHGLPLAALLEAVARDLSQRRDFTDRTEAGLAGPRATAAVLAGLPLIAIGLGELMGAHPLRVLLGGSLGSILLVVGVGLAGAGVLWADAITARVLR